jgi:hypothetical protein
MLDTLPDNDLRKNLTVRQEGGDLKVTFYNKKSENYFIQSICKLLKDHESFLVISGKSLPKVMYAATIEGKQLKKNGILQRINKFNDNRIETSRWNIIYLQEISSNTYIAVFVIPAKEYLQIKALNNVIKFGTTIDKTFEMKVLKVQSVSTIDINGCRFEVPFIVSHTVKLIFFIGLVLFLVRSCFNLGVLFN